MVTSAALKCNGTSGNASASGWQATPQFKALGQSDKDLFTKYLTYDNGQLPSVRDSSCSGIVTSASFQDSAVQPAMLDVIRAAPSQAINQLSRYITSSSYSSPDLSKMSNKDVKNAQCCLIRVIGAICSVYVKAGTDDVKTIVMNTMDGFCTGATAIMLLVDATDPIVAAHANVGDLVYNDRRIGINTVGFGITSSAVSKPLDLVCTLAHGYGHWLRFPFHTAHQTPANSPGHYADELISYYTEFAVRWGSAGHPDGSDMEKATDALGAAPYTYKDATGDDKDAIDRMGKTMRTKASDPSGLAPDGASWNYLNNS